MKILLLEPYFTGSHKSWAEGYQSNSAHEIKIISLPGQFWKWRMHGGAITIAKEFLQSDFHPDLIIATDMLDLTTFLSLTRERTSHIPTVLYFHENQITYPWSITDRDVQEKRDVHYGFINLSSALAADHVLFNSQYHLDSFMSGGKKILKHFPDHQELDAIDQIQSKSQILYLGMDLVQFDAYEKTNEGLKVSATHNGYYLGYGIYHTRELLISKDGDKISGNDELKYQGAPGNIPLLADIRFHLCPDLKAAQVLSGDILLRLKNKTGWIFKVKNLIPKLKESIFIKDGDIMKTEQIVFSLPLGDLRSRGSKTLQWELYKSL